MSGCWLVTNRFDVYIIDTLNSNFLFSCPFRSTYRCGKTSWLAPSLFCNCPAGDQTKLACFIFDRYDHLSLHQHWMFSLSLICIPLWQDTFILFRSIRRYFSFWDKSMTDQIACNLCSYKLVKSTLPKNIKFSKIWSL